MGLLQFVLTIGLMFLSAVACFMGAVVTFASLTQGVVHYSFGTGADTVSRTVTMAGDATAFWQSVALLGLMPIVIGLIGIWWGRRRLRTA